MEAAAKSNLKHVSLELGGKSPVLVFDDANVDMAVELVRIATFTNKASQLPPTTFQLSTRNIHSSFILTEILCIRERFALQGVVFMFKKEFTMSL